MTPEQIDELLENEEDLALMEPREKFDPCIVGVAQRFNSRFVVYDKEKVLAVFAADQTDDDDPATSALEFFEFNVVGAWVGEGTPAFIDLG
jgi:hypothetical protein